MEQNNEQKYSITRKYEGADNEDVYAIHLYHAFRQDKQWTADYELEHFSDHYHGCYESISEVAQDIYDADYGDLPNTMKESIDWDIVGDQLLKGEDDAYYVYMIYVPGFGDRVFIYNNW